MSCPNATEPGLDRLSTHWMRHHAPASINYQQQRSSYAGLKGWGRTRFVIHNGRLLYLPPPKLQTGCVLRRTPILAWALLETLQRHPDLPDVSIPFNCRDKPTFWYPDGPQPHGSYEIATTAVPRDKRVRRLPVPCRLPAPRRLPALRRLPAPHRLPAPRLSPRRLPALHHLRCAAVPRDKPLLESVHAVPQTQLS